MPYLIFALFAFRYGLVRSILAHIFIEFNQRIWTKLYHFYVAKHDPAACPSLFLYSKTDQLVSYDLVKGCATEREACFGKVWRKCWDESGHVRHIYQHEDEYNQQLREFAVNISINE